MSENDHRAPGAGEPQQPERSAEPHPCDTRFRWGIGLLGAAASALILGALQETGGELASIGFEWIQGMLG